MRVGRVDCSGTGSYGKSNKEAAPRLCVYRRASRRRRRLHHQMIIESLLDDDLAPSALLSRRCHLFLSVADNSRALSVGRRNQPAVRNKETKGAKKREKKGSCSELQSDKMEKSER